MARHQIAIKRIYETPEKDDGTRVLVERLWPRGFTKERAHIDLWLKEIAPSNDLRHWFNHEPAKFDEFRRRYEEELKAPEGQAALKRLSDMALQGTLTLVYSAHDSEHNNAVVLRDLLNR
jgi:uncharacterized protein YeaO (DUF488 family)